MHSYAQALIHCSNIVSVPRNFGAVPGSRIVVKQYQARVDGPCLSLRNRNPCLLTALRSLIAAVHLIKPFRHDDETLICETIFNVEVGHSFDRPRVTVCACRQMA
jgi:hypothetical protein